MPVIRLSADGKRVYKTVGELDRVEDLRKNTPNYKPRKVKKSTKSKSSKSKVNNKMVSDKVFDGTAATSANYIPPSYILPNIDPNDRYQVLKTSGTDYLEAQKRLQEQVRANLLADKEYTTKDSGEREKYSTGAQRDSREGKGRYDLIPPIVIKRYAELLETGSRRYLARNWEAGMPLSRYMDSAMRHMFQLLAGETGDDHAAAVIFNVGAIIHHRDAISRGELPAELDDLPKKKVGDMNGKLSEKEDGKMPSR